MQDDNLMPNDSTYFVATEPVEQQVARKKEKANTLEALPILKTILEHFDERIAFYNSVDSIPAKVKTDPTKFMTAVNANDIAKRSLMNEKEYIESLLDSNAKNL